MKFQAHLQWSLPDVFYGHLKLDERTLTKRKTLPDADIFRSTQSFDSDGLAVFVQYLQGILNLLIILFSEILKPYFAYPKNILIR